MFKHRTRPKGEMARTETLPNSVTPARPSAELVSHVVLTLAFGALLIAFATQHLASGSSSVRAWVPFLVAVAAAASCALRAATNREIRSAWIVWSLALVVWGIGWITDARGTLDTQTATTVGDVFRVAFYPLAYLGAVQAVRGRITRFASSLWLDGLIGAAAVAAVGAGVILKPAFDAPDQNLTRLVLDLILPLGDMLLLAFIAGVMALNDWRPGRAWLIIGAGFGFMAVGHAVYVGAGAQSAFAGELATLLVPAGLAFLGYAPWHPATLRTSLRLEGWGLLVGPTLFGWLTVALVAYGNFVTLGSIGLVMAVVTLVLVMVRTALTFRENIAIAGQLREEVARSAVDALTGLGTHRAFHETLDRELSHARRHGRELAVAVIDIDEFRLINQRHGHETGDEVIARIGAIVASALRNEDVLARVGGEEFAVVMPSTDMDAAWYAMERARRAVDAAHIPLVGHVTISAGVCDIATSDEPEELMRLAEGALYWAKTHGRNVVERYSAEVMDVLSDQERAEQAERRRTLSAITALARAVDAKDPTTQEHSQHVATLAAQIAERLGLPQETRRRIHEAGLVHDVGKIGVPDAVLTFPGRLNDEQMAVMREHAALGAQIVADVLSDEQTAWVRHHHERLDGAGYPDGLQGHEIPLGARIIAVADSWDAMTANRVYRDALDEAHVIDVLRSGAGVQWCPEAISAFLALHADGLITARGDGAAEEEPVSEPGQRRRSDALAPPTGAVTVDAPHPGREPTLIS